MLNLINATAREERKHLFVYCKCHIPTTTKNLSKWMLDCLCTNVCMCELRVSHSIDAIGNIDIPIHTPTHTRWNGTRLYPTISPCLSFNNGKKATATATALLRLRTTTNIFICITHAVRRTYHHISYIKWDPRIVNNRYSRVKKKKKKKKRGKKKRRRT